MLCDVTQKLQHYSIPRKCNPSIIASKYSKKIVRKFMSKCNVVTVLHCNIVFKHTAALKTMH